MASDSSRYSRQSRFAPLGRAGQARLHDAKVLVCGCGALGSVIAERLARAGIGQLRLVDRDWVELSNLQRQSLFTEQDAQQATPKAVAAQRALQAVNSDIDVQAVVEDLNYQNLPELAAGVDLIMDGTDNFETRFLVNDFCVANSIPWVHGGCLGASGQILTVRPGETACFRCLVPEMPPRSAMDTCDTAGVLGSAIGIIASWQTAEALKLLAGHAELCGGQLLTIDSWNTDCRVIKLPRTESCVCCQQRQFPFLNGEIRSTASVMCGKNAVQIESQHAGQMDPGSLAEQLKALGEVQYNAFFVRLKIENYSLTIFRGGRTVIEGTTNEAEARSVLTRTLGS